LSVKEGIGPHEGKSKGKAILGISVQVYHLGGEKSHGSIGRTYSSSPGDNAIAREKEGGRKDRRVVRRRHLKADVLSELGICMVSFNEKNVFARRKGGQGGMGKRLFDLIYVNARMTTQWP